MKNPIYGMVGIGKRNTREVELQKEGKMDYSFKRGTKNEKGWSCRGRPLKTEEFGAIMGMKLATTAKRKKEKGRVRILLYPY
uniref:Uncharacterized protein n=1 Tax=Wuchereria bancrofti TaxID=6293 RepID=A0A1I8EFL9_WUCBA